jgi:prepilin peptidase CpaA
VPSPIPPDQYEAGSRFLASVGVTFFGFVIFLPIYVIGGVGAGDVKMQMGYGAWVGAFCGLYHGMGLLGWGYLLGIVVGGVLGFGIMLVRREFEEYRKNAREILLDLATCGNVGEVAERAAKRKTRQTLLPYGIPLCIGYLSYLWYHYN